MNAPAARAVAPGLLPGNGEDRAALRRVRVKLCAELDGVRRSMAAGRGGGAGRLSLLAQGLEGRGHHASSLLLDELCLAAHVAQSAPPGARTGDSLAVCAGLDALGDTLGSIGQRPGTPLAGLAAVDGLRAARGAQLASANLPWEPADWWRAGEDRADDTVVLAGRLRPYLQKGLLGWLRDAGDHEALALVDAVFERLADGARRPSLLALAQAARAWVEWLRTVSTSSGAMPRRLLGGFDAALRRIAAGEGGTLEPRLLRTVAHALLVAPEPGPRAREFLDALGLEQVEDLLSSARDGASDCRRELSQVLERVSRRLAPAHAQRSGHDAGEDAAPGPTDSTDGDEAQRPRLLAELVACADALAFIGEGVMRREVLVLASALDEPRSCERLAALATALRLAPTAGQRDRRGASRWLPPIDTDEGPAAVIPPALLGDLDRARGLIDLLGEDAAAQGDDASWMPPELEAVLAAPETAIEPGAGPEPTLDAIDLATLAERARGLLADVSEGPEAGSGAVQDADLAASLRAEGLVLDDDALENLTTAAGAIGEAHAGLERRVGSLRESLGDMARTIAGLRGQLERLDEPPAAAPADAPPPGFDAELAGRIGMRLAALGEGLDELATLHEAATRLTRETESLLVRQARDHVELQRGLLRTRLVPVASRAAAWQAGAGRGVVTIEGGEIRVDQGVLAGVSPVVESLLASLLRAPMPGGAGETARAVVAALVAGGELHLELRGPPAAHRHAHGHDEGDDDGDDDGEGLGLTEAAFTEAVFPEPSAGPGDGAREERVVADAQAAMLELGGRLHRIEGDGSARVLALQLPLAPPLRRVLTLESAGEVLAVPLDLVEGVINPEPDDLAAHGDGVRSISHAGRDYPLACLAPLLGLSAPGTPEPKRMHVVFLRTRARRAAIAVDSVRERNEVVTRPLDPQLAAIPWLSGACITGAERPVLILDAERLIGAIARGSRSSG